jgi:hypothetical protein
MSKVLLNVTFRTHQQFTADPNEDRTSLIKQRIDIADAGKLEQDRDHLAIFTFSLPCEIDLSTAQGVVALNLANDKVAALIRHISNAVPDAVIIASSGSLVDSDSVIGPDTDVIESSAAFETALSLLGEIAFLLPADRSDLSGNALATPAITDCLRRISLFFDECDKDRSADRTETVAVKADGHGA